MNITHQFVSDLFANLENGNREEFFRHVSDNVVWRVMGSHPLAGIYTSKKDFVANTFARLNKYLKGGVVMKVHNVLVSGDSAAVEMSQLSQGLNDKPFNNTYCWVVKFKDDTIVQVTAYLDSALVKSFIEENEK